MKVQERKCTGKGETESVPVFNPATQIAQLQALASELKTSFAEAMQELSRLQHGESSLKEKVQSCQCAMEEKVAEMKNSLNGFKEELCDAKSMIEVISAKQEEMWEKIEQLQQEKRKESRKLKVKRIQKEDHGSQTVSTPLQGSPFRALELPEPVLINEDFAKLLQNATYEKDCRYRTPGESNLKRQISTNLDAEESLLPFPLRSQSSSTLWKPPKDKDAKEWSDEHISGHLSDRQNELGPGRYCPIENLRWDPSVAARRQNIALDLLESETKYVVSLSLVLNIKATHGMEVKINVKESFFPKALQHLVQQHIDLLHALQERVLNWPQQRILGDMFLRLTNDENNFLDYYIAYLRDLPECISMIHVVILKKIEEEMKSDLYIFFFHIVQRIPEYLLYLQNILKYTEQEHPDYYLLLVCVQRLQVFISHYSHLFKCNEDLLIQKQRKLRKSSFIQLYKDLASRCACNEQQASPMPSTTSTHHSGIHSEETTQPFPASGSGKTALHLRTDIKKSQQGMASIPGPPCKWETDARKQGRPDKVLTSSQFNAEDSLLASLLPLPDIEFNVAPFDTKRKLEKSRQTSMEHLKDSTSFTPESEDFDYRGNTYTVPGCYEKEPLAVLQNCSPASSESSLDICFWRPVNFTREPEKTEYTLQPLPKSVDVAQRKSSVSKREAFRSKGKQLSQSLKEFPRSASEGVSTRLYSTRSSSGSRLPNLQERGFQPQEASSTSRSSQWNDFLPQTGVGEKQSFLEEMHIEDTIFSCTDNNEQTSFSSHVQKGRVRSSFRKLFRKK